MYIFCANIDNVYKHSLFYMSHPHKSHNLSYLNERSKCDRNPNNVECFFQHTYLRGRLPSTHINLFACVKLRLSLHHQQHTAQHQSEHAIM